MHNNSNPNCRFCKSVAMEATSLPANPDKIRGLAWLFVAIGLGLGAIGHGNLQLLLGGLLLAVIAFPLTDDRLVRVWACPSCQHRFPRSEHGESPRVIYAWRPLPTIIAILAIIIIGTGIWPLLALFGQDVNIIGRADPILERLYIALGYGALVAVAIVFFESLNRDQRAPFIWRAVTVCVLLLGLVTTANAAIITGWMVEGPAYEWVQLTVLAIGEGIILLMAMRRSRLFMYPLAVDEVDAKRWLATQ